MLRLTLKNSCHKGLFCKLEQVFFLQCAANKTMVFKISSPRSFCSNFVIKILLIKKHVEQVLATPSKKFVKTAIFFRLKFPSLKVTKGHFEKNTKELQFWNKKYSGGRKNRTASLSKVVAHFYWLRISSFKLPRGM